MNDKHIFLTHTYNGYIGAYIEGKYPVISYAQRNEFIKFTQSLKEDYPNFKQTYIVDDKIRQKIEDKIMYDEITKKTYFR